ncbi:MAG: hypothetical protein HN742_24935 [Lentisphaerae bacterium]|jgi:hypothetical protein|nr:hypothetical protein [Lentisphaerota bacterium]MBT4814540.1 hypothetical protein [Lentisphaerota bacterium]MBT5607653.1 hypothetical protein [Lentisphaerota bacterium]MBT7054108.1 hypothetical protein [Lentisphaerota bacterium]MBT7845147.1 hypothetical protein [Lentisphaerota bacterium]
MRLLPASRKRITSSPVGRITKVNTVILLLLHGLTVAWVSASPVDALLACWTFDRLVDGTIPSEVRERPDPHGNTGAVRLHGGQLVPGVFGQAVAFDGEGTFGEVSKTNDLNVNQALTLAAWVKPGAGKKRGMILSHEYAYRLCINQGGKNRIRFQLNLGGEWAQNWLISETRLTEGEWYHVVATYDGAERRIYINGELDARDAATGAISDGRGMLVGAQGVRGGRRRRRSATEPRQPYRLREAFVGALDELCVWGRALSPEDARWLSEHGIAESGEELSAASALTFHPLRCVTRLNVPRALTFAVANAANTPHGGELSLALTLAEGTTRSLAPYRLDIPSGGRVLVSVSPEGIPPGEHVLEARSKGRLVMSMPVLVMAPLSREAPGQLSLEQVLDIDLARESSPGELADDGTSRVVDGPAGRYLEAGPRQHSRFVVRLPLRRTGRHIVRVRYPDDRARSCEIATWSPAKDDRYNAHTGYLCGDPLPVSGTMQTFDFVMWARDTSQCLVFTSWLEGQPAAAARIQVFEQSGRLPAAAFAASASQRLIGHYWEDAQPMSRCFSGGKPELGDFERAANEMCDYLDYSGQNLVMHPLVWYEGPIYNSLAEARGGKGGFHMPTEGWVDILLERFEERDFTFFGLFNVHELPSLVRATEDSFERVVAGAGTFNTVTRQNDLLVKTWHHQAAAFNALHPAVQGRVVALVAEIAERYGGSPAFGGIGFHLTLAQLLLPGFLDVSYDDWTVGEFARQTGVRVPAMGTDPVRFGRRHDWLKTNAWERWLTWRCEQTAAFYVRAADRLREERGDLKLVVTILEPPMSIIDAQREQWLDGMPQTEIARLAGVDVELLSRHPGIVIQKRLGPSAYRKRLAFGTDRARWGAETPPRPDGIAAIRDMDLDAAELRGFKRKPEFGTFLYNRYFESSVGARRPLECPWYGGIPWRATAVVPAHEHFLEYYARSLAAADPSFIATGGFTNGTVGHEARVAQFARVYRRLPVGDWREIVQPDSKVVMRELVREGVTWVYAINPASTPQPVVFATVPGEPVDGSPRIVPQGDARLRLVLRPYQLGAWRQARP